MPFLEIPGSILSAKICKVFLEIGRLNSEVLEEALPTIIWGISIWIISPNTPKTISAELLNFIISLAEFWNESMLIYSSIFFTLILCSREPNSLFDKIIFRYLWC